VTAALNGQAPQRHAGLVDLTTREVDRRQRDRDPSKLFDTAHTISLLHRVDDAARARSASVKNVSATQVSVTQEIVVATSDGRLLTDRRVRIRTTCRVTARHEGRLETGFCGPGAGTGVELYEHYTPEAIGTEAADRALNALAGHEPPGGTMPVVLGSSGGGLLLHEACAHGLEADGLTRNSSAFAATPGQTVGSRLVTAIDDPSLDLGYGSYGVDDEGSNAGPTMLLESGVQVGAMTDSATAALLGRPGSGNGRRESYARPPLPRMSNTFITPGNDEKDSIIGGVKRGVYVATLKGGDVNIATGEFAFAASEAYLIERGEITRPLAGLTLMGNGPSAMASIEAVGNDLSFTQALCGKEEQWVPVSYGSPTLLVTGLTVTGRNP
ncbi:MAG TPA: TldD/PmbA family protein, partial [Actinomycetes bacterium]|nr:TldD/PmbA family protein [Actinomycetes bacterium]